MQNRWKTKDSWCIRSNPNSVKICNARDKLGGSGIGDRMGGIGYKGEKEYKGGGSFES